jgi:hypothetical protein
MNIGALIVLIEALKDIEKSEGLIGPPAPNGNGKTFEVKPNCGPGQYAFKPPDSDLWVCRTIPSGR